MSLDVPLDPRHDAIYPRFLITLDEKSENYLVTVW